MLIVNTYFSTSSSEKEEGEVGEAGEGERFKFWIKVDVVKVTES